MRTVNHFWLRHGFIIASVFFIASSSCANSQNALAVAVSPQFKRTSWSAQAGAPPDIWAFAQRDERYLWLGTGAGLYKFDGVRFDSVQLSSGRPFQTRNINSLAKLSNGDLWIGYFF